MRPYQTFKKMVPCRQHFYFIFCYFFHFFSKDDVLSQGLYLVILKGNSPVIMNTTKATKHVISSYKLLHAR